MVFNLLADLSHRLLSWPELLKAARRGSQKIELPGSEFLDEKRIQGSNMGSNRFRVDMPRYVDLYMSGRLKLDELVSARIGLDQINQGFEAMRRGEVARSVITFG